MRYFKLIFVIAATCRPRPYTGYTLCSHIIICVARPGGAQQVRHVARVLRSAVADCCRGAHCTHKYRKSTARGSNRAGTSTRTRSIQNPLVERRQQFSPLPSKSRLKFVCAYIPFAVDCTSPAATHHYARGGVPTLLLSVRQLHSSVSQARRLLRSVCAPAKEARY